MTPFNFLRRTCAFSLAGALMLHSAFSVADDTEIFFGTEPGEGIKPNVLFILDDSGSMGWCLNKNNSDCSTDKRMKVLKDTMNNLLNTTSGINVGLMVLNNSAGSAGDASVPRLLQPVSNIDSPISVKISSPEIKISADDASRYNGSNNTGDPTLVMGYINNPGNVATPNTVVRNLGSTSDYSNNNSTYYERSGNTCSVKLGTTPECPDGQISSLNVGTGGRNALLLFRNLNIPKGVNITNAVLQLDSSANATSFNVSLASSKTPEALNHGSPQSNAFPANPSSVLSTKSSSTHSLDITSLLKAQQNLAPTLNPIGDLLVRLRATSSSTLNIAVGDVANAPQLIITYTGSESSARTTGLRFQTVNVPQGATITRATLNFVPASSDDRNVSFAVAAEASDDASDFSGADFSTRPATTAATWTPAPWRTENPPVVTDSGADVTEQVQTVVNRAGWCGNNAMAFIIKPNGGTGSRTAISQDGNDGFKPVLSISYTGGDSGCSKPIVNLNLSDEKDDARQYKSGPWFFPNNTTVSVSESTLPLTDTYTFIGARFQQVPFKKGATVNDVRLYVTPNSNSGTTATADVYFHNVDNSPAFNTNDNNLGGRAATTKASCTFTSQGPGIPVFCDASNLKNALQSVLNRSGWSDGNSLSVLIKQTSASSSLSLQAFESNRNAAISLQVTLDKASDLTDSAYKVRDYMKGLVQSMNAYDGTPLVDLLYQAASYYTALPGKHRGPASPIESSCQANYLVLMSDGQANLNSTTITNNAKALIGSSSCTSRGSNESSIDGTLGETCGVEIARWLRNTDQSTSLDDDNTVITHTVGFALQGNNTARKFLADVATAGGGKAYTADDASALASAFSSIIQEALASDTTFVSATAPVNSFNRQDHKDQLYFSLFRPSTTDRWPGNLKRYRMGIQNGSPLVLDADGSAAIDANTGFFRSSARSWWSSGNDGSNVVLGGAANQLPSPTSRNLWTNINGDTTLNRIETLTPAQTAIYTGNHSNWINYIRGYESGTTTARNALGDPIHATPTVVTYQCTGTVDSYGNCSSEKQSVIVGTNEGFVQMFDTNTGAEQFAFMPKELLGNIERLAANANMNTSHLYGMDNSVTVWANDKDKNGAIDGSDFVYAYATMGRGGRNIYALDITNPTAPKLKWQIKGGSGDFSRLGQTWSAPVKAKIKVGATERDVLIFAGGYDTNQDKKPASVDNVRRTDGMGNDLFIVDAESGARLWSAYKAGIDMKYSVPSRVSVIGLETDAAGKAVVNKQGLVTQIFVGDMGGQVWRFLINNGSSGNGLATGKVFASIASDTAATARRFYHEPAIALINANNKVNLTVSIGSGYRGHPLDKIIQDRFYSFRTEDLNALGATLTEGDLYDASSLTKDNSVGQQALLNKSGWYINLAANGEKVLSSTMVIGGELYFNTYQPVTAQDACRANTGVSRGYRVNLLDGTAVNSYRYSTLKGSTLPSNPQLYCKGDTCWAYNDPSQLAPQSPNPPTCTGPDCPMPPEGYDMASKARLYWTDKTDD
ncbi:pilus assembly protein [Pseudomonas fluvialis]|uniref:pilus assembly protein n=1 Tax=Pseudomonas fluvialis TaxID=1793966 RepID=UPI0035AF9BA1